MAKANEIREILKAIDLKLTDTQIDALATDTPAIQSVDAVINELMKHELVNMYTIKRILNNQPKPERIFCGHCNPQGIQILDTDKHTKIQYSNPHEYHWLFIPKRGVPCPNCSGTRKAIDIIRAMSDAEQTWTWIVLYSQVAVPGMEPIKFDPAAYWPGIIIRPSFTPHQSKVLRDIYQASQGRDIPLGLNR